VYKVYIFEKWSKCTYISIITGIRITVFTIRKSVLTDSVTSLVFYKLCSKVCESILCWRVTIFYVMLITLQILHCYLVRPTNSSRFILCRLLIVCYVRIHYLLKWQLPPPPHTHTHTKLNFNLCIHVFYVVSVTYNSNRTRWTV